MIEKIYNLDELQPRARIFYKIHGYWNNLDFMHWINDKVNEYKRLHNCITITDHDDFTNFLRKQVD